MAELIVMTLFLSAGLCGGLPTVIWALYSLRRHQEAGGRVSAFIISLILSDIGELLMSPFVNTSLLEGIPFDRFSHLVVFYNAFWGARICGLHFHQLVALEWILSLVYPSHSHRSFLWTSILSLTVWSFVGICYLYNMGIILPISYMVPLIMAIITSLFTTGISHSSAGLQGHKRPGVSVLAVALLTLVVLYVPHLVLLFMRYADPYYSGPLWAAIAIWIVSLRVVTEPLLCVLVCRDILKYQTPETTVNDQPLGTIPPSTNHC